MALERARVACTVKGATTLGEMWRMRMGQVFTPTLRAFSTYSKPLAEMTEARTVRAKTGMLTIPMATMVGTRPRPSTVEIRMARRMEGKAKRMSIRHMMTRSTQPSK